MADGIVARLISDKGFGFIRQSNGNELFFHRSAVLDGKFDSLKEGTKVTFDAGSGPKGPRAENVEVV